LSTNKSIYIALAIHNHQPVGNLPSIFEDAFKKAYEPFLKLLAKHPSIKVSIHFSGLLLQWLCEKHPDYATKLKDMNTKGQLELLTGGFYEPILPAIPDRDKIGQINKLTKYIEEKFSFTAKGMWLTERVWEPHLAKPIQETGVEFTLLDENQFRCAGLTKREDICGYYVTEEQGFALALFPISYELRHAIPFQSVTDVLELIKSYASEEGNRLLCFADDGEKFGFWPGSYKNVYEKGWLERFFEKLEESSWIKVITFSEYRKKFPPLGRIYIPVSSYPEMMEWALSTHGQKIYNQLLKSAKEEAKSFIRGGMWRNFLVKYQEANNLHKKSLYVSQKVEKVKELEVKTRAQEDLWKGEANDAYWHGVFGGLYLPHLRDSVYRYLIRSEYLVDTYLHRGGPWMEVEILDFDKDSLEEVLVSTDKLNLYFRPAHGGQIFELDYKVRSCNYQNLISRREEPYHERVGKFSNNPGEGKSIHDPLTAKEQGLDKQLFYDWYPRYSLIDHFLHPDTTLENFARCKYGEQGDFVNQIYHFDVERSHEQASIKLWRDGHVWVGKDFHPVRVEKRVIIPKGIPQFTVEFHLANGTTNNVSLWYATEISFNFLSKIDPDSGLQVDNQLVSFSEALQKKEVNILVLKDGIRKVEITLGFSKTAHLWQFPLHTISQSESGYEKVYQGTVLLPNWHVSLGPKGTWKSVMTFNFKEMT
jgi:hypothetical protein